MVRAPQKGAPLGTKSGNAMPPEDKIVSNGVPRPTMPTIPTLSAATKAVNKTPITPRVASLTPSQVTTPLARRVARQEPSATLTASQSIPDISTPVSAFLSNITPRSSSRKSRVDSANTTPTHTHSTTPAPEPLNALSDHDAGLGINGFDSGSKRPTVSFSPALSEVRGQRDIPLGGGDTRFFYASDAKSITKAPRQRRLPQQNKNSSFFYANGDATPSAIRLGEPAIGSATGPIIGEDRSQPMFFHACEIPDLRPQPSYNYSSQSSNVSSTSLFTSQKLTIQVPACAIPSLQRPKSSPKFSQNIPLSAVKSAPAIQPSLLPRFDTGHSSPEALVLLKRRASADAPENVSGREKSAGIVTLDPSSSTREISEITPLPPFSPLNLVPIQLVSASEGSLSGVESDGEFLQEEIQNPVRAGHSLEHMNELAANARRERKVLDLEITNSSLAAINRTLEREMRKQTAELRRYRRLSRSGRLSINTATSLRTSDGAFSIVDRIDDAQLSDMTEEGEECEDGDDDSSEGSVGDTSLSPTGMAESDAKHREKDEKRLMLDLSKHQQLLIDSQKMNQSLKRCLGWTEELIKEGKKSLAYNIRVSDVRLGGRVLDPDEVEGNGNQGLWDADNKMLDRAIDSPTAAGWNREGKEDGDSGIELESENGLGIGGSAEPSFKILQ